MTGMRQRLSRSLAAGLFAAAAGLAGCSSVQVPHLNPGSVSRCYRAIPPAKASIHDPHSVLVGVHRVPARFVTTHLALERRIPVSSTTKVCAVAFRGSFTAASVTAPNNPAGHGSYAIVVVTSNDLKVVVTFVRDSLPRHFAAS